MRGTGKASEFASTKLGRRLLLIFSVFTFCLVLVTLLTNRSTNVSENASASASITVEDGFMETRSLSIDAGTVPEIIPVMKSKDIRTSNSDENASNLFNNPMTKADDPILIKYLQQHNLFPPPNPKTELRDIETSEWAVQLKAIFNSKKNGFFIECGANDGEFLSNSYKMEVADGWNGLLIEANPFIFPKLVKKQRNAWISDACLAIVPYPQKVEYIHRVGAEQWKSGNGLINPRRSGGDKNSLYRIVQPVMNEFIDAGFRKCYPLYTFLLAVNVTTVDYLSLDVQGYEYQILNTIPFDKVTVKVISAEHVMLPEGKPALIKMLEGKGYELVIETSLELFFILSEFKSEFM